MSECLICGRWQDSEPRCECYEEMLSLTAKLQTAERYASQIAHTLGVCHCADGHDCEPGPLDEVMRVIAGLHAQAIRAETAEAKMDNLAALVRILVHSLRKVNPNSSNIIRAMDYLKRHRLTGSILRSDEPQPKEIPESGGHIESADCWCSPTVEEHPGGRLVIHNQTH